MISIFLLVSWNFSLWWQSVSRFFCCGQARGESRPSKYSPWHCEDEALLDAETYTEPGLCATQNGGESDISSAWSVSQSRPHTWLSRVSQSSEFLRIRCKRYTTRFSETPLLKSNTVCLPNWLLLEGSLFLGTREAHFKWLPLNTMTWGFCTLQCPWRQVRYTCLMIPFC